MCARLRIITKKIPRADELPEQIQEFNRIIFRRGVYVLGCGGGVIPEPRCAIKRLKDRFSRPELLDRCLEVSMLPTPLIRKLTEGVWNTIIGMIYHLGDESTLEKLIAYYPESEECRRSAALAESTNHGLGSIETLIAGLALKTGRPFPEGIDPISNFDCKFIFCPDRFE